MTESGLFQVLRLMRPFWRRAVLALLLSVLTIGSSIALMMTSAWLISTAALQLGITSLGLAPTAVRFFGLSRAVFRYLERLVSHDVTFRLLARLRVWFYKRIEPLSLVQLQAFRSGDLMARVVTDIEELQNFYLRVASPPIVAVIVTAVMGAAFSLFDGRTALVLVAFMLVTGSLLPWLTRWIGDSIGRQLVDQRTRLNSHLIDTVQGLADSVAFGYTARLRETLEEMNGRLTQSERQMGRLDGLQNGLSTLLVNLAALCVLWVAIGRVEGVLLATLTLGTIAAFEAITPLALAGQNLGKEQTAANRVFEIINSTPAVPEAPPLSAPLPPNPALTLAKVTFRYGPEEQPVFTNFSLAIPYGTRVLLTGESGAGKSSLINVLLRFAEHEAGQILVGKTDLCAIPHEAVRQLFGVMTQRTHLFNTTVGENIRIGQKTASDEAIVAAAQAAQIHTFITSLPDGYDTYVGEGGARLSGGERQRIALARMLLKDAPIWLLDEITANLDPITATTVLQTVLAAGAERTIILMTHRTRLVASHPFNQHVQLGR
ncbi:MAG: thiol reductant ABC exporter subunit CydC [Anaerolineaceae bacterium]|nr:thiol reductant ABC exporter subunit CydC [Anaerolineaceae bacterium]